MDILWWWKCGRLDLRLGVGEGATLTGWLGLVGRNTETRALCHVVRKADIERETRKRKP